jgi:transcriptional regulator with XRE-family HTH domain
MYLRYNVPICNKEMIVMKDLSYKLKIERARAGMTLDDLARISKIGRQTISRIENGSTIPRISTLGRIAKALDIDVEEFIEK